ncbi:MAG TPA: MFS transporter [Roseiflexaceae bacterium]|nr:MFS transporter [Roseiflexaceae bacterium]
MSAASPATAQRPSADFWKFWAGQTISNLGSSFTEFALPLLIFKLTGSAINLAIASATTFLPYLLFGLLIGAWVDRVNRKRLMIATDLLRALVLASIPLLAALDQLTLWWIYAASFLISTLTIGFNSAEFAAIPSMVAQDDLVTANGRIQASYSAATVAGPLLAGLLIAFMPLPALLLIDATSFVVSAGSLVLIGRSFNAGGPARAASSIWQDVSEGLRYVLGHPVLRNISAMMALVNFVGSTVYAQLVLFAKQRLLASDTQVALLYSAGSVGVVLLSLAAGPLRKRWSFSTVALGALALDGLLTIGLALTSWYWAALPIWMLCSGLGILFNINTGSLRQAIVPNHLLGRVISIAGVLAWSAIPLGTLLGGLAISWTGDVALIYAIIGVLTVIIPLLFALTPLGHAERYMPAADEQAEELRA